MLLLFFISKSQWPYNMEKNSHLAFSTGLRAYDTVTGEVMTLLTSNVIFATSNCDILGKDAFFDWFLSFKLISFVNECMDPYVLKRHFLSFCREIMWTKFYKTVNSAFFLILINIQQKMTIFSQFMTIW